MCIYDNCRVGKYKNNLPYPIKPLKPSTSRLVLNVRTLESVVEELKAYPAKLEDYESLMKAYRTEEGRLHDMFMQDLRVEFGTVGNPKEPLLYEKAYDRGHSGGYEEIASAYDNMAELIK